MQKRCWWMTLLRFKQVTWLIMNILYLIYWVLINLLYWLTHNISMFSTVSRGRFELRTSLYVEKLRSTSTKTNGAYLVSARKGSSVKIAKVFISGLFFKFYSNLTLTNPSRLSLILITFFHCFSFSILSPSKLWITSDKYL